MSHDFIIAILTGFIVLFFFWFITLAFIYFRNPLKSKLTHKLVFQSLIIFIFGLVIMFFLL